MEMKQGLQSNNHFYKMPKVQTDYELKYYIMKRDAKSFFDVNFEIL